MRRLRPPAVVVVAVVLVAACGGAGGRGRGGPSVSRGKQLFAATCVTCHGLDGKGVPSLGKDLTTSEFVAGRTDDEMVEFILVGRPSTDPLNTSGIAMPPRAGNPALTDADLGDIVAYLRSIHVGGGPTGSTDGPTGTSGTTTGITAGEATGSR